MNNTNKHRQTDRQTDRQSQTDRPTDRHRQTQTHTNTHTDADTHADTQTHRQTDAHTHTHTHTDTQPYIDLVNIHTGDIGIHAYHHTERLFENPPESPTVKCNASRKRIFLFDDLVSTLLSYINVFSTLTLTLTLTHTEIQW
jgi:hypothetical protein